MKSLKNQIADFTAHLPLNSGDTLPNGAIVMIVVDTPMRRCVMAKRENDNLTPYVTWVVDPTDNACYWGHYFRTWEEARADLGERVGGAAWVLAKQEPKASLPPPKAKRVIDPDWVGVTQDHMAYCTDTLVPNLENNGQFALAADVEHGVALLKEALAVLDISWCLRKPT